MQNSPIVKTKAVFGPIPSRRLGLSLGIDLLPFKTCPLDCVYCECGATTNLTAVRKEYYPTESVIAEIDAKLAEHPKIDYLTFSGVGEPTLHAGIGRIIGHVKSNWPGIRVCVITNAVLLGDPGLQEELRRADLIMPSLDASNEAEFATINRPADGVSFSGLVEALRSFRKACKVTMWLEIFIVPGVNDSPESIARFRTLVQSIGPDKIQLNSLDRPGVAGWIGIPTRERLEELAAQFDGTVPAEIISRVRAAPDEVKRKIDIETYNSHILATLRSRPCTAPDLAAALACDRDQISAHLRRMEKAGLLISEEGPRGTFYRPAE